MTKEEIIEGNKLIAEFMGVRVGKDIYSFRVGCTEPLQEEHLAYEKQWGWLMPVVEKISKIKIEWEDLNDYDTYYPRTFGMLNKETGNPMVRINSHQVFEADSLIEAAWLAVIDFIKWYNNQSITKPQ